MGTPSTLRRLPISPSRVHAFAAIGDREQTIGHPVPGCLCGNEQSTEAVLPASRHRPLHRMVALGDSSVRGWRRAPVNVPHGGTCGKILPVCSVSHRHGGWRYEKLKPCAKTGRPGHAQLCMRGLRSRRRFAARLNNENDNGTNSDDANGDRLVGDLGRRWFDHGSHKIQWQATSADLACHVAWIFVSRRVDLVDLRLLHGRTAGNGTTGARVVAGCSRRWRFHQSQFSLEDVAVAEGTHPGTCWPRGLWILAVGYRHLESLTRVSRPLPLPALTGDKSASAHCKPGNPSRPRCAVGPSPGQADFFAAMCVDER